MRALANAPSDPIAAERWQGPEAGGDTVRADEVQYSGEACPVCRGTSRLWRVKHRDGAAWRIERCTRCGHGFVHPRPTLDFLMEYYATSGHGEQSAAKSLAVVLEEERRSPNTVVDAQRIVRRSSALLGSSASRTFLDVGCGYGFFAKEAQSAGFTTTTLELASIERGIATEMLGTAPVATSFEAFDASPGSFSVVLMSQILEHALDVNAWVVKARDLLEPGGVLAVALPNFDGIYRRLLGARDPFIVPPAHLNYFTPRSLRALLERHGFVVERLDWVSRVPRASLERRFKLLAPIADVAARATLSLVDAMRLGVILNAYAKRPTVS